MRILSISVGPTADGVARDKEVQFDASVTLEDKESGISAVGRAHFIVGAEAAVHVALADAMGHFTKALRSTIKVRVHAVPTWVSPSPMMRTCGGP
jgi:hypothetical protein